MWHINALALTIPLLLTKLISFHKGGQTPRSRSQGKNCWYLITEISCLIWYSCENIKALALTVQKLLTRLKFSKKWVKLQGQGHRVENNGTYGKVLSQRILMSNIKALAINHWTKVVNKVKVFFLQKMSQTPRSRSQGKKYGLIIRNTHVKYEISSTHCSKFRLKFQRGEQNDLRSRGHKKTRVF